MHLGESPGEINHLQLWTWVSEVGSSERMAGDFHVQAGLGLAALETAVSGTLVGNRNLSLLFI